MIFYSYFSENASKFGCCGYFNDKQSTGASLSKNKIDFLRADVGDKYVLNELVNNEWLLGGEPSGHIICLDSAQTGDAIMRL